MIVDKFRAEKEVAVSKMVFEKGDELWISTLRDPVDNVYSVFGSDKNFIGTIDTKEYSDLIRGFAPILKEI